MSCWKPRRESITYAAKYERSEERLGYRSGRNLTTISGDVTLHMPRLKGISFKIAIMEHYRCPYVYVDDIYLCRNWGGAYENVAILVAIAVNEDKASWAAFFQCIKGRGLEGVKIIVGDKCMGMLEAVVEALRFMKLKEATKKLNVIERLNREIRRRTQVVSCFPDGNFALMLVCARLRHVAGTQWGNKKYMNTKRLKTVLDDAFIAG